MKNYKLYTESVRKPQQGDYVICQYIVVDDDRQNELNYKIKDQIGRIQSIDKTTRFPYIVKFNRRFVIGDENYKVLVFGEQEIVEFAKTKEELELKIQAGKYNL